MADSEENLHALSEEVKSYPEAETVNTDALHDSLEAENEDNTTEIVKPIEDAILTAGDSSERASESAEIVEPVEDAILTADDSSERASENAPEKASENAPESASENAPESASENAPESALESPSENASENAPESASENAPESASENAPESALESPSENASENAPESAPENDEASANDHSDGTIAANIQSDSLIGWVTESKCCDDLNKKLFGTENEAEPEESITENYRDSSSSRKDSDLPDFQSKLNFVINRLDDFAHSSMEHGDKTD